MHIVQDVRPARTSLDMEHLALYVQVHRLKAEHVQDKAARSAGLPTHGVTSAGYTQWKLPGTLLLKIAAQLLFWIVPTVRYPVDVCDRRAVQAAGVVDKADRQTLTFVAVVQRGAEQVE